MPPQKTKTRGKRRGYHVEFSLTSLFFWGLGLFFLLAWIFVLGILVGRGFLPEGVRSLSNLKAIAKFQDMVSNRKSSDLDVLKKPDKDPKFAFYDELSAKKEEAGGESRINVREKGSRTTLDKGVKPSQTTKKEDGPEKSQVELKASVDLSKPDKRVTPPETGRAYTVQIASLEREIMAIKMVNRLVDRGYPVYYREVNIKGKIYYRVRCGKFKTKKEASDLKRHLASQEGIKGFITKVDK